MNFNLGYFSRKTNLKEAAHLEKSVHLLDKKMFKELFPDSLILEEKVFGLTKSLFAIKKILDY